MGKQYLFGGLVSLAAVWFFLAKIPLGEMGAALARLDPVYLLPCLAIYVLSYLFRALRWHYLMRPVARVPVGPLFATLLIGFLANNLLPAHLGEVVRAYLLGSRQGVSKSATLATVVMERIYDGLTVLFLLLLVLWFMDLPAGSAGGLVTPESLRLAGWLGLALFAGLLAVLQALCWQRERALAVCGWLLRPLPARLAARALDFLAAFTRGLAPARPGDLFWVAFHSLAVWLLLSLWAWSLFPAFGLSLSPWAGVLMEVVVALALLIPAAPAFLGTFHLAAAATLGFLGADTGVAGSYAMVLWLTHFVSTTALGLFFLWRQGLHLRDLGAAR